MPAAPMTWAGASSVSAARGVFSDPVATAGEAFSAVVTVFGSSPNGASGNLIMFVSDDGVTYAPLLSSLQSVLVTSGQSQTFSFSGSGFEFAQLQWVPGSATDGTLGSGSWSITSLSPPVVDDFDPPVGATIYQDTPIAFEVTDPNGLGFAVLDILVAFPSGAVEAAYTGSALTPLYQASSSVEPIAGGYAFTLLRLGGWPGSPTITPNAVDTAGNVNA